MGNEVGQEAGNQNDTGQQTDNLGWRAGLPEDMRGIETLAKFTGDGDKGMDGLVPMPVSLAQGYVNAEQLIGRDKIPMPKTDEDWNNVYNRLGRPETADEYTLVVKDSVPEKIKPILQADIDWLKPIIHSAGLSNKQAAAIFDAYTEKTLQTVAKTQQDAETYKQEGDLALRQEFGQAYDGKMMLANRAAKELGGQELLDFFDATGAGNFPPMVKAFIKIGERMSEELGLDKMSGMDLQTKDQMIDEIAKLQSNPAYLDASHPQHDAIVMQVQKLNERIYGVEPVALTLK